MKRSLTNQEFDTIRVLSNLAKDFHTQAHALRVESIRLEQRYKACVAGIDAIYRRLALESND